MKNKLKKYIYKSKFAYFLLYIPQKIWRKYRIIISKRLSDEEYIIKKYKEFIGKDIDLKHPRLFTEKIQWLKLYDRNDLYTKCADKYLVRSFVEEKIGSKYLIPLVYVTENYNDINKDNLPDYPVIIKTTHDSGSSCIIFDKNKFDFNNLKRELSKRLKNNFYYLNREWEYKNIKPRIIVEKLLRDDSGNTRLNDYKIHCFHGRPMFIQTIFDRGIETKEDWYDTNWNMLDVYYFSSIKKYIKKPKALDELLSVAEKLSKEFPYVRVDLYISNNQVYFGELTFRPYGGFMKFIPDSFDLELGNYLNIGK